MRAYMKIDGKEDIVKDKWFMAFLGIITLDYAGWIGYSYKECHYCSAAVFMILNSIIGTVLSCLWALLGLVRGRGQVCEQVTYVEYLLFEITKFMQKKFFFTSTILMTPDCCGFLLG